MPQHWSGNRLGQSLTHADGAAATTVSSVAAESETSGEGSTLGAKRMLALPLSCMPVRDDPLQAQEVPVMKLHAIPAAVAVVMVALSGVAFAGGQTQELPSVTVHGSLLAECAPPNDQVAHACDTFNELVYANFTSREIGMLFGYRTSYPENLTGGIERLQSRYQALMEQYVAQQGAAARQVAKQ